MNKVKVVLVGVVGYSLGVASVTGLMQFAMDKKIIRVKSFSKKEQYALELASETVTNKILRGEYDNYEGWEIAQQIRQFRDMERMIL